MARKKESNPRKILRIVDKLGEASSIDVEKAILANSSLCESLNLKSFAASRGISKTEAIKLKSTQLLSALKSNGKIESSNAYENSRQVLYRVSKNNKTKLQPTKLPIVNAKINTKSEFYIDSTAVNNYKEINKTDKIDIYSILDNINKEFPQDGAEFIQHRPELDKLAREMFSQGRTPEFIAERFEENFGSTDYDFDFNDYSLYFNYSV